jgi:acetyltransferase-like isoleucine patch superfamily enzyme
LQGPLLRRIRAARTLLSGRRRTSIYLADKFPGWDIGKHSYGDLAILAYSSSDGELHIGRYCSFADGVKILLGGEHRTDWVSTYPFNVLERAFSHIEGHPRSKGTVSVGNDVWLGRGAVIMSGVTVGNGAVVGAYSVVTRNVPPYAVVAGNPARLVRMRFPTDVVDRLQEIRWWDWPDDRVRKAAQFLQSGDIEQFIQLAGEGSL